MPGRTPDINNISQNLLYPLDDPNTAFTNALQDMGVNPYRSNPFVSALQKGAQGSRISFLADKVFGGTGQNSGVPGQDYGAWLRGRLGSGTLMNEMTALTQGGHYGQLLDKVRGFQDQMQNGMNIGTLDPYMSALNDIFSADGGRGALAAYGSLRAPNMGSLGQSYTRALSNFGDSAHRRFLNEGDMGSDPWQWMFGSRGGNGVF